MSYFTNNFNISISKKYQFESTIHSILHNVILHVNVITNFSISKMQFCIFNFCSVFLYVTFNYDSYFTRLDKMSLNSI